ncbi:hypothetical protein [Thermococcus sp. 21S7]|uniref:hypothetical protein n=1 Tax=Thermococcus sp. 21S7 TaxID=1638221 RepID=UPI00143CA185|nr:hypothetical protein [Thermococcus sp. 21S7]NJE60453.1 hypothetical protein [Thermococcus sp. 21S7]
MVRTLVYAGDTLAALVAEARWREQAKEAYAEVPTLLEWLEREIAEAREAAFSAMARRENGAEYWSGWADALETLQRKIQKREVRA